MAFDWAWMDGDGRFWSRNDRKSPMPTIASIAIKPEGMESRPADRFARVAVESAELVAGRGIAGDRKAGRLDRHLNVMSRETLDGLQSDGARAGPGETGEQLVFAGIDVDRLGPGTRLRLGRAAVIEVVQRRQPCGRFEQIQRMTIKTAWGRLGVMCRVLEGGPIRLGDEVDIVGVNG
jgi:MOSC domain-containing protein YiiM